MGAGFRRKTYRLKWPEEHELSGLEVVTRGLTIKELQIVSSLRSVSADAANLEQVRPLFEVFAGALVSWNYEDEDGEPIGTSLAALEDEDFRVLLSIILTWVEEVSSIASPLSKTSTSGPPSPAASDQMEELLASLQSSNTPS